jgi:hypothetical protein
MTGGTSLAKLARHKAKKAPSERALISIVNCKLEYKLCPKPEVLEGAFTSCRFIEVGGRSDIQQADIQHADVIVIPYVLAFTAQHEPAVFQMLEARWKVLFECHVPE